MRRTLLGLVTVLLLAPSVARAEDPPRGAVAPATSASAGLYTLGGLARDLAQTPGAVDAVFAKIGTGGSTTAGPIPDAARAQLEQVLKTADWSALDSQPQLTLSQMGLVLEALGTKKPYVAPTDPAPAREALGIPVTAAAPLDPNAGVTDLGFGVQMGAPVDPTKASMAADSARLASVLDRLALNRPGEAPVYEIDYDGHTLRTAQGLIAALRKSGHTVTIEDNRRVANFADLSRGGRSVAAPVWVKTGHMLADGTELLLPAPHAELVIHVSGPEVNAVVSFFNGIDTTGPTSGYRFRGDTDTRTQDWVGGKIVNTYTGDEIPTAMKLMSEMRRDGEDQVRAHEIPLGGYFTLGVCSLAPAVVEKALRGKTTLWPLTEDNQYFQGDDEASKIIRSLPVDGRGGPTADAARLLASVPWSDPSTIPFPGMRAQVQELATEVKPESGFTKSLDDAAKKK